MRLILASHGKAVWVVKLLIHARSFLYLENFQEVYGNILNILIKGTKEKVGKFHGL
jgi:hypothetical protein